MIIEDIMSLGDGTKLFLNISDRDEPLSTVAAHANRARTNNRATKDTRVD